MPYFVLKEKRGIDYKCEKAKMEPSNTIGNNAR
jgi:hypothetical protein